MQPSRIPWIMPKRTKTLTATEILKLLPNEPGDEREGLIFQLAVDGHMPKFNCWWCPVPVVHTTQEGRLVGTFYCTPDFLCLGTDEDFVRVRINPLTAEQIIHEYNGLLPTVRMVDAIYCAAQHIPAQPWGPPYDHSMLQTSRWPMQDRKIAQYAQSKGYALDGLKEGHLKNVVIGAPLVTHKGRKVGIYGWFKENGTPIQGPTANWKTHEWTYADYSHGVRPIRRVMTLNGEPTSVTDILKDKVDSFLLSTEGPLLSLSYSGFLWMEQTFGKGTQNNETL